MGKQIVTDSSSSLVRSASYDEGTQVLTVTFKSGRTYAYHGVPSAVADRFAAADSQGRVFNSEIRGSYEYEGIL